MSEVHGAGTGEEIRIKLGETMNELQVVQQETRLTERLSASQIRADVNLLQEVMQAVMKDKVHYGTVPGCGDKPTLLKPGAEKIASTFRLAIDPQVEDLSKNDDEIRVRVAAKVTHQVTGQFLGTGIGEASTNEEKYKWRKVVSQAEWDATPEDRRRIKYSRDYTTQQIRTNPADVSNTVIKMAKKRALVDAVLTITAASDIFTQDIEDLPEEFVQEAGTTEKGGEMPIPKAKESSPSPVNPKPEPAKASIPAKDRMRSMGTKKSGKCRACTNDISVGDPIYWDGNTFSAYHPGSVGA